MNRVSTRSGSAGSQCRRKHYQEFGEAKISGNTIVADDGETVYVFVRNGTVWTEQAKIIASDADQYDIFGVSVAISGDTVVAGAPQKNQHAGAAYVQLLGDAVP